MLKNIFIAILSMTTIYLGWIAFPQLGSDSKAFASSQAFTTNDNGNPVGNITYSNCSWTQSSSGNQNDWKKANIIQGSSSVGKILVSNSQAIVCPNGQVATGVGLEEGTFTNNVDSTLENIGIMVYCCTASVANLFHQ